MMSRSLILFSILLGIFCAANAQEGRLADFNAVRLDRNNVEVRWTMRANVSCQSPQVQRSLDGENFSTLYVYPGVCGGSPVEESFSWIDNDASQSTDSYYRLRIDEGEYSRIDLIERELLIEGEDIRIFPNPVHSDLNIHYDPKLGKVIALRIYDSSAKVKMELDESEISVNRGVFTIELLPSVRGLLFLEIEFESGEKSRLKLVADV